jgi:hypothetical protein
MPVLIDPPSHAHQALTTLDRISSPTRYRLAIRAPGRNVHRNPAKAVGNVACGRADQKAGNWINECNLERPVRPPASNVDASMRYLRLC